MATEPGPITDLDRRRLVGEVVRLRCHLHHPASPSRTARADHVVDVRLNPGHAWQATPKAEPPRPKPADLSGAHPLHGEILAEHADPHPEGYVGNGH